MKGRQDDAWIILDNKVYDVTSVLGWHPGGANAIMTYAGKATVDVTNEVRLMYSLYREDLTRPLGNAVQGHS